MKHVVVVGFAVVAFALALPASATSGAGAAGSRRGVLTYDNQEGDILAVAARGGPARVVVRYKRGDPEIGYYDPSWSRDGHLAVTRYESPREGHGYSEVYVVRPRPPHLVADVGGDFTEMPSWAPDGRRVVVVGVDWGDPYRVGGLYVATVGAESTQTLVPGGFTGPYGRAPAWSPDGSLIAFARTETDRSPPRLYVIDADGTEPRKLTSNFGDNPSWSPDSSRIVFDDGHRIAAINADGTNLQYLTKGSRDSNPAWSPDGRTIGFVRGSDVWVMDPGGRNARRIARRGDDPAWMQP